MTADKADLQSNFDQHDDCHYPRPEESDFSAIVSQIELHERKESVGTISQDRRGFLKASLRVGLSGLIASLGTFASPLIKATGNYNNSRLRRLFTPIKASTSDTVIVPDGFTWEVLLSWGDPLWSTGSPLDHETGGTGESQELAFGDNNDGMELFASPDGRLVLAVNNEYSNLLTIYPNRLFKTPSTEDDMRKVKAAHGISIFEIKEADGQWRVVIDSNYNRRITAETRFDIAGPLRGYESLKTIADPHATTVLGTWNNCGSGRTPWGTYLSCEENFNSYFSSRNSDYKTTDEMNRYGIGIRGWGYDWERFDSRFDIAKNPNESNRHGYVVEIDPLNPQSVPRKLTALGRFKHENAELVVAENQRIVIYMGDDERGEYLYRYVSDGKYQPGNVNNPDLLNQGRLSVAEFFEQGTGRWLELSPELTAMSEEEIALHTRQAASRMGATTMDRPEWIAASPDQQQVMMSLTNNKYRGARSNQGGDPMPVDGPNPRSNNLYGQILRWVPVNGDHTAPEFHWDLFAMMGNPALYSDARAGSPNITQENMFNSPDGLSFSENGLVWIRTDGKYSNSGKYAGMGNNQMLVGDPYTGAIERFLVAPREAEVTGLCWSPDRRAIFVGIQHPGARGGSHFPSGDNNKLPQSSVIAIRRKNRQPII